MFWRRSVGRRGMNMSMDTFMALLRKHLSDKDFNRMMEFTAAMEPERRTAMIVPCRTRDSSAGNRLRRARVQVAAPWERRAGATLVLSRTKAGSPDFRQLYLTSVSCPGWAPCDAPSPFRRSSRILRRLYPGGAPDRRMAGGIQRKRRNPVLATDDSRRAKQYCASLLPQTRSPDTYTGRRHGKFD